MSNFHFAQAGAVVVAGCETIAESGALLRWVAPVLDEWPPQSWQAWIAETSGPGKFRAAMFAGGEAELEWREVDVADFDRETDACRSLAFSTGLVFLAHKTVASHLVRALDGLASRMTCFAAGDPAADQFKKYFASFGVSAGLRG